MPAPPLPSFPFLGAYPISHIKESAYALPRPPIYIHKEVEVQPSFRPAVSVQTVRPRPTVVKVSTTTTQAPLFEEQVDEFGGEAEETTVLATQRTTQPQFIFTTPTTQVRHEFTIVPIAPVEPVQDVKDDYDDYTEFEPGQDTQVTQDHVVEVSVVPTRPTSTHIPTTSSGYSSTTTAPRTPSIATAPSFSFQTETTTARPMTIPFRPVTMPPPDVQATVARPNPIVLSNAVTPQTVLVPAQPVQVVQTQPVVPNFVQVAPVAPVAPQVVVATARPTGVIHTGAVGGSIGRLVDQTFIATAQPAQIIHVQTVGQNGAAGSSQNTTLTTNATTSIRAENVSLSGGQLLPGKTVLLTSQPSQLIHVQPVNDNVVAPQTFISSGSQGGSILTATASPQIFFATAVPGRVSQFQTIHANVIGQPVLTESRSEYLLKSAAQVQEAQKVTAKTELPSSGNVSKSTTITVQETKEEPEGPEGDSDYGQSPGDILDTAVLSREIQVDTITEEEAKKGTGYNRRDSNANYGRKKASGIVQNVRETAVDLMEDEQNSYRRF
ncbi:hypothetical protein Aduo_011612 [Ancylostoma duodenale]